MAEAAAREPSMEDILASIRKIIAQDDARERPAPQEPASPRQTQQHVNNGDERRDPFRPSREVPAFGPLPPLRPEPEPSMRQFPEPVMRPGPEPAIRTAPEPAVRHPADGGTRSPPTLASLTEDVRRQMPRPVPQPQPAPRTQANPVPSALRPIAENSQPRNPPSLAALAGAAMVPQPAVPLQQPSTPVSAPQLQDGPSKHANPAQMPLPAAQTQVPPPAARPDPRPDAHAADQIVSPATSKMVAQSIDRLKAAVADDTSAKVEQVLRPMLKEWLDKHLPAMVERIVREEIERIARG